jgi:hypothetical protein
MNFIRLPAIAFVLLAGTLTPDIVSACCPGGGGSTPKPSVPNVHVRPSVPTPRTDIPNIRSGAQGGIDSVQRGGRGSDQSGRGASGGTGGGDVGGGDKAASDGGGGAGPMIMVTDAGPATTSGPVGPTETGTNTAVPPSQQPTTPQQSGPPSRTLVQLAGGARVLGGSFEGIAGWGLFGAGVIAVTTGGGVLLVLGGAAAIVGGGLVMAHGADQAITGTWQIASGQVERSATSVHILQGGLGMSPRNAELADAAISILAPMGAGRVAVNMRVQQIIAEAPDLAAGLSRAELIRRADIGGQALSGRDWTNWGQAAGSDLARYQQIQQTGGAIVTTTTGERIISTVRILPTGPTARVVQNVGPAGSAVNALVTGADAALGGPRPDSGGAVPGPRMQRPPTVR